MTINPLAGKPAEQDMLVNVPRIVTAYYAEKPDAAIPAQRISFGTSGHRGSSFKNSFNENHILAITQAICFYRKEQKIDGPLYLGFRSILKKMHPHFLLLQNKVMHLASHQQTI